MGKFYQYYRAFRGIFYYIPPARAVYDFFFNQLPKRKRRKLLQQYGVRDLGVVVHALDEAGIEAFCDYGTLLGIIRNHALLPHDDDLDMGILDTSAFSWEHLESAMKKSGLKKVHVYTYEEKITEQAYQFPDGLSIDFYLYQRDHDVMRCFEYFRGHGIEYADDKECSVRADIHPPISGLRKIAFADYEPLIPENAERHLEEIYGPGWRTPDPAFQPDRQKNIMPKFGLKINT